MRGKRAFVVQHSRAVRYTPLMNPTLKEISEKAQPVFEKYGVVRVRIFGPFARGDARPDSDVDFLVSYGKTLSLWDYVGFRQDLKERLGRAC